jgi:Acyl-CoA thioesterase C-terminal domain/Acyl-CoA thioesterase N-terminal domain
VPDALYEPDHTLLIPTELTRGPWSAIAQHGGPPAALLARAAESFDGGEAMLVVRLTIELLRPVPLAPLRLQSRLARPGRKVQLIEVSLSSGNVEVARAVALRIRRADVDVPPGARVREPPPSLPQTGTTSLWPWSHGGDVVAYHSHAVEHRFVAGGFDVPGPATDWIRLRVPLVAGEPTPPFARVAAAADFGNGISWVVSRVDGFSFINPDLTIYLHRHPAGEWVCLEAITRMEPHGVALAESRLWDERGAIGRSLQSLIVERG